MQAHDKVEKFVSTLRRFPYGVVYQIPENEILIIAFQHLHREPDYWHDQI